MLKKMNLSSPIGIALTVAGLALALSPGVRRAARRWLVQGTAGAMDAMERVGGITTSLTKHQAGHSGVVEKSKGALDPQVQTEDDTLNEMMHDIEAQAAIDFPDSPSELETERKVEASAAPVQNLNQTNAEVNASENSTH